MIKYMLKVLLCVPRLWIRTKRKKLIPLFHEYVGYEALYRGSKNYAVVVVGSDQVWPPMSLPNKFFNLLFVDDRVRKVAYASSLGVSVIPRFQRKTSIGFLKNSLADL